MPKVKSSKSKNSVFTHRSFNWKKFFIIFFVVLISCFILNQFVDLNPKWKAPAVLKSQNGILNVTLEAKKSRVNIGGKDTWSNVWNGRYIAPTWEVRGGDTIKVHFVNNMSDPTNLHFHGGHISPKGNSDNVLLNIKPGETFDYEYKLPKNHPPGFYWYHPHLHRYTDNQVMNGMLGAIKVLGDIDELPRIKGVKEETLVLTTRDNGNNVDRLVNNQINPSLYIRPFETIRLRILNASSDDFYNLSILGTKLNIISRDGNTLSRVDSVNSEVLAPGDRIEVLFQAQMWGTYTVKSLKLSVGSFVYPEADFMTIKVRGLPVLPKPLPTKLVPYQDLKETPVDNIRTLIFSEAGTDDNPTFLLDGKEFDANVVSQLMTLGTTEQWNLINKSNDTHPFHIHINPFQVISVNGKSVDRYGYDDTFPIPPNGEVVIKTQYKDFDGKYVLHCHILFHEDHGMMQVVEVVKPGEDVSKNNGLPERESMPGMNHQMNDIIIGH